MNVRNLSARRLFTFFRVIGSAKAYRNLLYLMAAFPLGVFYFVFLVSGISTGISLVIVWVGIPILILVGVGWWFLAGFERMIAIHWLNEDIPAMTPPSADQPNIWTRIVNHLTNPATWKSLLYLMMKFPLGVATFVIVITLVSLTLAFLSMPFIYETQQLLQGGGFFGLGLLDWNIDSMADALLAALIGILLWPITLHVINMMTWVHAKFATLMLSYNPIGSAINNV